ncbi:hypothetical protein Mgra_00009584 [Meloidogyne graminicola]|uniref:Uncharacterized protein n=1 Tax=Meloidogyne graminicola TaxID=189291 RepID=A0A8S9ZC19_9BILA|nr:hypothetical protein Mgra_00009584 [Meloidogyne graminicola]
MVIFFLILQQKLKLLKFLMKEI